MTAGPSSTCHDSHHVMEIWGTPVIVQFKFQNDEPSRRVLDANLYFMGSRGLRESSLVLYREFVSTT